MILGILIVRLIIIWVLLWVGIVVNWCCCCFSGNSKLGFSFVRISCLMTSCNRLWIGTGNGVILSVPLSESRLLCCVAFCMGYLVRVGVWYFLEVQCVLFYWYLVSRWTFCVRMLCFAFSLVVLRMRLHFSVFQMTSNALIFWFIQILNSVCIPPLNCLFVYLRTEMDDCSCRASERFLKATVLKLRLWFTRTKSRSQSLRLA